jgi:glycosyltransferase involved in cell wall biosynthesis
MSTQTQPHVSLVTPVYNGAEFLHECIESVLAQTHPHWDYTILNNCSTDRTLEVAEEYAKRDPRIRIVNNATFLKIIPNHNAGVRLISPFSKYCKMVFADDWLYPECLEKMIALAEQNPSVGIVGSFRLVGSRVQSDGPIYGKSVVTGRDICRSVLLDGVYPFGTPGSLLFRSDLVRARNSFFNESNLHADSEVCYELLKESDFGFVHQVLTFTRLHEGTLTSLSWNKGTLFAGNLSDLVKFGPLYLGPAEFNSTLQHRLSDYYRFLGGRMFEPGRKSFLNFHSQKLNELGLPLNRFRVWLQAGRYGLDKALALNWWPNALLKWLLQKLVPGSRATTTDEVQIQERHLTD